MAVGDFFGTIAMFYLRAAGEGVNTRAPKQCPVRGWWEFTLNSTQGQEKAKNGGIPEWDITVGGGSLPMIWVTPLVGLA
jgi:hypothetical protein